MAVHGDERLSVTADSDLSDEQTALLDSALRPLPRSLTAEAEEGQLIEHALANAPALFAASNEEWNGFVMAKRFRREANRPVQRAMRRLQAALSENRWGLSLTVLGALLLLAALAAKAPATAQARPLAIALLLVGALLALLPKLSRLPLRALRLELGIDFRWAQARLAGASPLLRTVGRLIAVAGLIALATSVPAASSQTLIWIGAGICGVGVSAIVSSRILELLGYGHLPLDYAGATVRWEAARQLLQDRLRTEGQMLIREKLNRDAVRPYETNLSFKDHSGLGEIDDPRREIPTGARRQLLRKMARLPGGTIGLAGSRGAGKTTLMRSICNAPSVRVKATPPLAFIVDAPVRYESRDFVLYLFARLCSEIVGPDRVRDMRGSDRPFGYPPAGSRRFLGDGRWFLGIGFMSAGLALLLLALIGVDDISSPFATGAVLLFVGYFAIAFQSLGERHRKRHLLGTEQTPASEGDLALVDLAMLRLRQIWFQQSFSSGWSGGFKVPIGESGFSGSADLAEQQLSLPDIVALFREFLAQVASRREVRIGIDELDKMDDEAARAFLNDIKVIFRIQNCFFLISISEDAMSFFERRGLPIRDVFDSSFDDVQYVPHLRFSDSRKLLERRVVDLPVPFAGLLHCISGGLPRDLVRAARELVDVKEGTPLEEAAADLLRSSMEAKVEAAKIVARRFELEEHTTLLIGWLDRFLLAEFQATALLDFCEGFRDNVLANLALPPAEAPIAAERRRLRALGTQLATFAYYAATALEFFPKLSNRAFMEAILQGAEGKGDNPSHVDDLAGVTQTFAVDITSAWAMISRFRERLQLEPIYEFPRLNESPIRVANAR